MHAVIGTRWYSVILIVHEFARHDLWIGCDELRSAHSKPPVINAECDDVVWDQHTADEPVRCGSGGEARR